MFHLYDTDLALANPRDFVVAEVSDFNLGACEVIDEGARVIFLGSPHGYCRNVADRWHGT
jgi:hypothetical protein